MTDWAEEHFAELCRPHPGILKALTRARPSGMQQPPTRTNLWAKAGADLLRRERLRVTPPVRPESGMLARGSRLV